MVKGRKTNFRFTAIAVLVLMVLTMFGVGILDNNHSGLGVNTNNLAGSTTRYVNYYGFKYISHKTGKPMSKGNAILDYYYVKAGQYKDVYNTTSSTLSNKLNQKYQYIDSYKGPTKYTRTEKYTSGTYRKTSFSGSIDSKIVKASIDHETGSKSTTTVSKKHTFPGDKKTHTLYLTRRAIDKQGKSKRTSYSQPVTSYTVRRGLTASAKGWGKLTRYTKRDIASHKTAATTEHQYGTYMN